MRIIDELGSYDEEIRDEENKTKILRTLPESYKPISMVCNITNMSFNDIVSAMNDEKERQNNLHNPTNESTSHPSSNNTYPQAYFSDGLQNRGRGRDRGSSLRGRFIDRGNGTGRGRGGYQAFKSKA